ncbi:MAG TPA: PAS domain S-box protein [Candidatus Obscuribacterales bacterium]
MALNLKLSHKGLILVAIPLIFELGFVAVLYGLLNDAEREIQREARARAITKQLNRLHALLTQQVSGISAYGLIGSTGMARRYQHASDQIPPLFAELKALVADNPKEYEQVGDLEQYLQGTIQDFRQVKQMIDAGEQASARTYLNGMRSKVPLLVSKMDTLLSEESKIEESSPKIQAEARQTVKNLLIGGVIFNILLAVGLAVYFNRGTTKRLAVLMDNTYRLAVSQPLNPPLKGDDEIAHLDQVFNNMAAALAESARKERAVIENAVDVICSLDSHGRLVKISPAALNVFGYAPDELVGQSVMNLIVEEDRQSSRTAIDEIRKGKSTHPFENRVQRKDGTEVHILWSAHWSQSEQSMFCVAHDITERKRAENLLRQSEARVRTIVETMPVGLVIINQSGFIELINPATERLFSIEPEEICGEHVSVLFPRSPAKTPDGSVEDFMDDLLSKAKGHIYECDARRASGETFPVELSLNEFQALEGPRYLLIMLDISERREVERLKQEFVSMVSHELRSPLTSVQGFLTLLAEDVYGPLTETGKNKVEVAERNVTRLIKLINDLLDIDRLEAGRLKMFFQPIDVSAAIERAVEAVRVLAEQAQVTVEYPTEPYEVVADYDRLVQVVINLLANAFKFSPPSSTVKVVVSKTDKDGLDIRVVDQGVGIPNKYQKVIFERFEQVNTPDRMKKGGSGLGLAICKAIVEQHGGSIGIESEEGKGCTIWFRLPQSPPTYEAA